MSLKEYQRKRRFKLTAEPKGTPQPSGGRSYVIQKHAASHLHYDFRLELDGALKSWAVPKGPSLDPAERVLAVEVEDHPVEYGSFEGTIPKGQYGGGTVLLWDRGTWNPIGDARSSFRKGRLKFELHGDKLKGVWNLVRMRAREGRKPEWLLIKHQDEFARSGREYSVLAEEPLSVTTGRTLEQIASGSGPLRKSKPRTTKAYSARAPKRPQPRAVLNWASLKGAKRGVQPASLKPQLATVAEATPDGPKWLYEIKFDGYRILCIVREGRVRLISRSGRDWTARFRNIARACEALSVKDAILDGEIVALDESGKSDFQALQNMMRRGGRIPLTYFIFDLPFAAGFDLRNVPLIERRQQLRRLLELSPEKTLLRFSDHIAGFGTQVRQKACSMGLEGVIAKHADSPYESRRSSNWRKIKCKGGQDFVVGGFTDSEAIRTGFGALLVGAYDEKGLLRYCGRVGTGFNERSLRDISRQLRALEIAKCPFADAPEARGQHWIKPVLVAEIEFTQFTRDGILRHSSFKGFREDKAAKEVVLERPGRDSDLGEADAPKEKKVGRKAAASEPHADANRVADVRITHPDRVLYPDAGYTKIDLARYFEAVAPLMLPHVVNRPLMVARCPEGMAGECFFQKHFNATFSAATAIRGVSVQQKSKVRPYLVVDNVTGLIELAQMGVLEIHSWGSRADRLEKPDRITFDLDPAQDIPWRKVVDAARTLRDTLKSLKLVSFVKLSGGKGLHVVVPIDRRHSWDQVEAFSKGVAAAFATARPSEFVAVMSKAKRTGKIFIDYLRNKRGATCVAPYSPRARATAPVSLPVTWDELDACESGAQFDIEAVPTRLKRSRDAWAALIDTRQRLPSRFT